MVRRCVGGWRRQRRRRRWRSPGSPIRRRWYEGGVGTAGDGDGDVGVLGGGVAGHVADGWERLSATRARFTTFRRCDRSVSSGVAGCADGDPVDVCRWWGDGGGDHAAGSGWVAYSFDPAARPVLVGRVVRPVGDFGDGDGDVDGAGHEWRSLSGGWGVVANDTPMTTLTLALTPGSCRRRADVDGGAVAVCRRVATTAPAASVAVTGVTYSPAVATTVALGQPVTVTATLAASGVAWPVPLPTGGSACRRTRARLRRFGDVHRSVSSGVAGCADGDPVDVCRWWGDGGGVDAAGSGWVAYSFDPAARPVLVGRCRSPRR